MRISDQERREIAKKLRYAASYGLGGLSLQRNLAEITKAEGVSWRWVMRRLADLIDRQACKRLEYDQYHWRCSRCGAFVYWDAVTNRTGVGPTRYCPNCGAEVVDE